MKVAVMQPYFLPYLGYYQLVAAADTFVFFDDVAFIKKGWIHRNQILQGGTPQLFSIPLSKASQNRRINEIELLDYPRWKADFLKLVTHNYRKAPQYDAVYSWLSGMLDERDYTHIAALAIRSVTGVFEYLSVEKQFLLSSAINYNREPGTGGQEKILQICARLGADMYINPKNGVDLYDQAAFDAAGLTLRFIHMDELQYPQTGKAPFVPYLSMLDVLMHNTVAEVRQLLTQYQLYPSN